MNMGSDCCHMFAQLTFMATLRSGLRAHLTDGETEVMKQTSNVLRARPQAFVFFYLFHRFPPTKLLMSIWWFTLSINKAFL